MSRRLALLLLALLASCGGDDPAPRDDAPADAPAPVAGPGPFDLSVRGSNVRVTGDPAGVAIVVMRSTDPADVVGALADPEFVPDAEWEQVATLDAAERVRLPALPPGVYQVVARRNGVERRAFLPVADLVLVVARSAEELLVFAADRETGRPARGASVVVIGPDARAEGAADATGIFRAKYPPGRAVAVLAREGDRLGVEVAAAVELPPDPAGMLVVTDRPAARPGETVRFVGLTRGTDGPSPDRFEVTDERGLRLAEGPVTSGSGSFRVPPETAPGPATILLRGEGGRGEGTLPILPRDPPTLALRIRVPARAVREDRIPVEISTTFFGGGPAAGATVRYRAWREGTPGVPALSGEAVLDATGTLRTHFVPMEPGDWIVRAEAEDAAGDTGTTERRIDVRAAEFELRLRPETRWLQAGTPLAARVDVRFPDGNGRAVTVGIRPGPDARSIEIEPGRETTIRFPDLPPGPVTLTAVATDEAGREARAEAIVHVVDGDDGLGPATILVVPDRDAYAPGETARVLVLLPLGLQGASILETIAGARLGSHAVETVSGRIHVFEARIPAGIGESATFAVTAISDRRILRGAATAHVGPGDGAIRIEIDADAFVRVTTRAGEPREARAVLSVFAGDACVAFHPDLRIPREGLRLPISGNDGPGGGRLEILVTTRDGRTAAATVDVPSSRAPFLELAAPPFLVRGDVAILRAAAGQPGDAAAAAQIRFEVEGLLALSPMEVPVALPADGARVEAELTASARRPGTARVRAGLGGDGEPAVEAREITVLPRARIHEKHRAGATENGRGSAYVDLPSGFSPDATTLTLHLGSGPVAAVLRAIAEPTPFVEGDAEDVLGTFLPAALAAALFEDWGREIPPELAGHEVRTREGLVALAGRQRADGGFGPRSDPAATARIVSGISLLRDAGIDVSGPDLTAATDLLGRVLGGGLAGRDPTAAAFAVRALADAAGDPGGDLAALAEGADRLPPGAAALLAPVLALDRDPVRAAEILDGLRRSARRHPRRASSWGTDGSAGFVEDPVVATAAVVRALAGSEARETRALTDRGVRFLLDSRRGADWGSPRRTAAACVALLAVGKGRGLPETGQVAGVRIRVGDAIAATARLDAESLVLRGRTVFVSGDYFRAGRNRIGLETTGPEPLDWSFQLREGVEPERLAGESRGITVVRETRIVRAQGGTSRLLSTESAAVRGELLLTSVVVRSEVPRKRVLVTVPVAGGARAVPGDAARLDPSWSTPPDLRTRLSERFVTFFLPEIDTEPVRLLFLSRTTASGRFAMLPAEARLADDPAVRGSSAEEILSVE